MLQLFREENIWRKKKKKELKGCFNTDACVIDVASNLDTVVSHLLLKRLVYNTESYLICFWSLSVSKWCPTHLFIPVQVNQQGQEDQHH